MSRGFLSELVTALGRWWRSESARKPTRQALFGLVGRLGQFLSDSTPGRRRQRYGDVEYDWDHRVDTTSATVGWKDRLVGLFYSPYQPTEPALFREMMSHLAIDFSQFTFVDIGSGKGRALLLASEFPFEQIVGVEILDSLHRIAEENVRLFAGKTLPSVAIRCLCEDAQNWVFPIRPLVVYLFNPLSETGLLDLMAKLKTSLEQDPRPVYVLYHNPVFADSLGQKAPGFKRLLATEPYCIYACLPVSSTVGLRSPGKTEDLHASKLSDGQREMPSTKATDPGSG